MGYGIFGYVEVWDDEKHEWSIFKKLETGDLPRGPATHHVFGYGSKTFDGESLFKDRGLPDDSTDSVREDYENQKQPNRRGGFYRDMFGHSHATANELSDSIIQEFGPFADAPRNTTKRGLSCGSITVEREVILTEPVLEVLRWWTVMMLKDNDLSEQDRSRYYDILCDVRNATEADRMDVLREGGSTTNMLKGGTVSGDA